MSLDDPNSLLNNLIAIGVVLVVLFWLIYPVVAFIQALRESPSHYVRELDPGEEPSNLDVPGA